MDLDLEFRKLKKVSTIEYIEFHREVKERITDTDTHRQRKQAHRHHDIRTAEVPLRCPVQVHRRG